MTTDREERKDDENLSDPGDEASGVEAEGAGNGSDGDGSNDSEPEPRSETEITDTVASGEEGDVEEGGIEAVIREKEEINDRYLRLLADFENYKRRAGRERQEVVQRGNEGLLRDLLPVIDNLERVLAHSRQEGSWERFKEGIELVVSDMGKTLSGHGLAAVEAQGKPFDPNLHEALQTVETSDADSGTVVEVFQKGYLYKDRLLRPALVVVAASPATEALAGEDGDEQVSEEEPEESDGGEDRPVN